MSGGGFAFDDFLLDARSKRLLRNDIVVPLSVRQFDVLHTLVRNAGQVVDVDSLMKAAWRDVTVNESSIHKIVSEVRKCLGANGHPYICNRRRHGYYFDRPTTVVDLAEPEVDLDALIEPHRTWIEGRAALETLDVEKVRAARATFADYAARYPRHDLFHIGLANASVIQFEDTRTDSVPDREALVTAMASAREACRLNPERAEAWAILGFVLNRAGQHLEGLAAVQRAVMIEPDSWLIQFRHGVVSAGEERYRAARRTLELYPHFPMAHWLAGSVYVPRSLLDRAEREIDAARESIAMKSEATSRFSTVAIDWFKGRLCLARGAEDDGMAILAEELALESSGRLYSRECCANTRCDMAVIQLQRGNKDAALALARKALECVPRHFMASVILEMLGCGPEVQGAHEAVRPHGEGGAVVVPFEYHIAAAARFALAGDSLSAADYLATALIAAPPGVAGWQIPIEPALRVWDRPDVWRRVLQILADRAS